jgi:hypothetical protein
METVLYKRHPIYKNLFCGTDGSIYKLPKMKLLKRVNREGRPYIKTSGEKSVFSHRLIFETFIGEIPPGLVINHINGIKWDNRLENLECVTFQRNVQHAFDIGLNVGKSGQSNPNAKLLTTDIEKIRERRKAGETYISIAKDYPVSRNMISLICRKLNWGDSDNQ